MKETKNKKENKCKQIILLPIIVVTTIIALGLIVFCLPINYNGCDSPCHSSKSKTTSKSGKPNPYEMNTCPTVCVVTYTTIWRMITGQDRISHY